MTSQSSSGLTEAIGTAGETHPVEACSDEGEIPIAVVVSSDMTHQRNYELA